VVLNSRRLSQEWTLSVILTVQARRSGWG